MKIKPEHYAYIKESIAAKIDAATFAAHKEALQQDERVKRLDVRLAFDCLYACVPSSWVCDNLYPYMNDTHLQAAVLRITKELFA